MDKVRTSFADRLMPAPRHGGFRMPGYWVWCGSVIRGEDGAYHLFAARWPKHVPFFAGYKLCSEIVRATSPTPEGPYTFQEVVLPDRGAAWWDGRMTHNPAIRRWRGQYLLFYIGATFEGDRPEAEAYRRGDPPACQAAYRTIRIGLATAPALTGPWTRREVPALAPDPHGWDSALVTNPAPCVLDDGRILMLYRSNTPQGLRIGAALADHPDASFRRLKNEPVLRLSEGHDVEDPFVWRQGGHFEALAKDMDGGLTGERHAGVHLLSDNGLDWTLAPSPKAYSRTIRWDDGTVTTQGSLERPQLLIGEDGEPTHLVAATADGPGGFLAATETWNMVIPLRPPA